MARIERRCQVIAHAHNTAVEVGNARPERISLDDDTLQEYSGLVVDLERPTLEDELDHAVQDGEREINGRQT